MTPFRDTGRLTQAKRQYNLKLKSCRQIVERAIGPLKCRFRRLGKVPCYHIERTCKLINACCVLLNICVLSNDSVQDLLDNYITAFLLNRFLKRKIFLFTFLYKNSTPMMVQPYPSRSLFEQTRIYTIWWCFHTSNRRFFKDTDNLFHNS